MLADIVQAIKLSGHVVGSYPLRVRPSKTAIVPVNRTYLPRTDAERELCSKTVYAANIDKKVDAPQIRQFFESLCGEYLSGAKCMHAIHAMTDLCTLACMRTN